jgi:hypothetical protein
MNSPRRRFAGFGQNRPSNLDSGWGLAGEEAKGMPNLPRGSLGYGTASNSGAAADPKCVRRRFAVKAFRSRGRLTSLDIYLKSRRGLWQCSPGAQIGPCGRVEDASAKNKRRGARGARGPAAVGLLPACWSTKSTRAGPWKYSGEIGRPATARGGWRGVAVSAMWRRNSGPSCRAVGGTEAVKRERHRGSASVRHRRGC